MGPVVEPAVAAVAAAAPVGWLAAGPALLVLAAYAALNLVAFVLVAWDKHRARRGERRLRESTLLVAAFFGGLGTIGAMLLLRHKTRKLRFLVPAVVLAMTGLVILAALKRALQ